MCEPCSRFGNVASPESVASQEARIVGNPNLYRTMNEEVFPTMKMFARLILFSALVAWGASVAVTQKDAPPMPCYPSCKDTF
jgi:hypothetical protein